MKIHFKLIGSVFCSFRGRLLVPHSDDSSSVTLYGVITGEVLQNVGLCSALRAFEQGGIFIVQGRIFIVLHLLWQGTAVFRVLSEGPPHLFASYDTQGDMEDLF
jgi:hypothetical protein